VQKNYNGAQMVMSQMQIAGVKPDSETFSYLIANCESEENISKVCHIPDYSLLSLCLFIWGLWKSTSWFWRTVLAKRTKSELSTTRSIPSADIT
jgi:hypothetical protein